MKSKLGNVSKLPGRTINARIARKRQHELTIDEYFGELLGGR